VREKKKDVEGKGGQLEKGNPPKKKRNLTAEANSTDRRKEKNFRGEKE